MASFTGHETPILDLSSGALPGLPMVEAAITGIDPALIAAEVRTDGYHPAGLPCLRTAIARRYTEDGLPTGENQILVTAGSQQAVWLVAHGLVGPGDEVVVEEPTYRGALEAFRAAGARPISVPVGVDGLDVAHLERTLRSREPRLLYCQPNVHNPFGTSMPSAARKALADVVGRYGVLTVEDTCNVDLLLDGGRSRPLLAKDAPADRMLSIGTASKLFWGGLRVGWIRADPAMIFRLTEAKKAADIGCAVLDQLAVADLLTRVPQARRERGAQLRAGLDAAIAVLTERRPDWRWVIPHGGTGLWVDTGADAVALVERARRCGVRLSAGPAFSAFGAFRRHIRLPTWHPMQDLGNGFDRLDA
jgi:DNA-binding transcriptional MocR family regulator